MWLRPILARDPVADDGPGAPATAGWAARARGGRRRWRRGTRGRSCRAARAAGGRAADDGVAARLDPAGEARAQSTSCIGGGPSGSAAGLPTGSASRRSGTCGSAGRRTTTPMCAHGQRSACERKRPQKPFAWAAQRPSGRSSRAAELPLNRRQRHLLRRIRHGLDDRRPATERPSSAKSSTSDGFGARSHAVRARRRSTGAPSARRQHASFAHSRLRRRPHRGGALSPLLGAGLEHLAVDGARRRAGLEEVGRREHVTHPRGGAAATRRAPPPAPPQYLVACELAARPRSPPPTFATRRYPTPPPRAAPRAPPPPARRRSSRPPRGRAPPAAPPTPPPPPPPPPAPPPSPRVYHRAAPPRAARA